MPRAKLVESMEQDDFLQEFNESTLSWCVIHNLHTITMSHVVYLYHIKISSMSMWTVCACSVQVRQSVSQLSQVSNSDCNNRQTQTQPARQVMNVKFAVIKTLLQCWTAVTVAFELPRPKSLHFWDWGEDQLWVHQTKETQQDCPKDRGGCVGEQGEGHILGFGRIQEGSLPTALFCILCSVF